MIWKKDDLISTTPPYCPRSRLSTWLSRSFPISEEDFDISHITRVLQTYNWWHTKQVLIP